MRVRPSRRALGLRGRILGAVLFTAVATLAVAALTLLGPLEQSLRHAELNTLRSEVGSTKRTNATSFAEDDQAVPGAESGHRSPRPTSARRQVGNRRARRSGRRSAGPTRRRAAMSHGLTSRTSACTRWACRPRRDHQAGAQPAGRHRRHRGRAPRVRGALGARRQADRGHDPVEHRPPRSLRGRCGAGVR